MINIPYSKLIEKISEQSDLSVKEIEGKVESKLEQLSGLISKEGAAHIVANELKVKITQENVGKIDVKDIAEGMRNIDVHCKVLNKFEVREFSVGARSGKVGNLFVGDETGNIRVTVWGSLTDKFKEINPGDVLKIKSCYVKNNNNTLEVHLNDNSELLINPEGLSVEAGSSSNAEVVRKKISEIDEKDFKVEMFGNVVQIFNPTFFELCPKCNKRIKQKDNKYTCEQDGEVEPSWSYIVNFILDDGSETMRVVCFREVALKVANVDVKQFMQYKEFGDLFDTVKDELMGKQITVSGRIKKNTMFDRIEMIADDVNLSPDVKAEIERLQNEVADSS